MLFTEIFFYATVGLKKIIKHARKTDSAKDGKVIIFDGRGVYREKNAG